MTADRCLTRKVVELGALALRLSRVKRITFHPNGRRPETDSDHTVMLGLIAPAFADRFLPQLDPNLVVSFALVHDLAEAYAGDTPTLKITAKEYALKKMKEGLAIDRIIDEYADTLPWVPRMLVEYERQIKPEARYVRALDKLLPLVTHILNQGATYRLMDRESLIKRYADQVDELMAYASDFPPLFELRGHLMGMAFDQISEEVSA